MPIYEYYCDKCEETFEEILPMAKYDEPTTEPCPGCQLTGTIHRGVPSSIQTGVDANVTPNKKTGGQWGQLVDKMKKGLPPSHHAQFDRASSNTGKRMGPS
jgi:putative FmdB family regulatory protein